MLAQKDCGGSYLPESPEVCLCSVFSPPVTHKIGDLCELWIGWTVADTECLPHGSEVDTANWSRVELHEALIDWSVDQGE